jgi:hypothetical protein
MKEIYLVIKTVIGEQDTYAFKKYEDAVAFLDTVVEEQQKENEKLRSFGDYNYVMDIIRHESTYHENHLGWLDIGGVYSYDLHKVILR